MQYFQVPFHVAGTLAANLAICWTAPFDCQLVHVSAGGSNANNGILDIGIAASAEDYLKDKDIGDSNNPSTFGRTDFVGGQFPHIEKDTDLLVSLDFDGAGGTATANFTLVLTFTVG